MQLSWYADECNKLFRFSLFPLLGVFDVYQTQEMGRAGSTGSADPHREGLPPSQGQVPSHLKEYLCSALIFKVLCKH